MLAIIKREFSSYFSSPIGYVFLAVFYVFSGFYFFISQLALNTTDMSGVFGNMFLIVVFLIPVLTMRLMSEDKKYKTDQVLLTSPINLFSLVMGKFLSAVVVYSLGMAVTVVYGFVIAYFATPDWAVIIGNILGMLLLGCSLIAIGMFISSLTENQVIAAVGGFAVGLFLLLIDSLADLLPFEWMRQVVVSLSFFNRYDEFTLGILSLPNVIFFVSVCAVFIFLTIRVFEKKRWA